MNDSEQYELAQYETLSVLKKSDSAFVELVQNKSDNKKYVKKTYHEDKRTLFNALKNVKSPYMAQIEKIYFNADTIVIEEYIEGILLSELIKSYAECGGKKHFNFRRIVNDLISAVESLHTQGIIHRDIKPSNIIVKSDGGAVLVDYSIARFYDTSKDSDTEHFGTIGYAPPEQYGFSQSDFKSDIYALGKTIEKLDESVKIPRRYKYVARKCCEFDPSRRFQSINEIRNYIKRRRMLRLLAGIAIIAVAGTGFLIGTSASENVVTQSSEVDSKQETDSLPDVDSSPEANLPPTVDSDPSAETETIAQDTGYESLILSNYNLDNKIICFPVELEEETVKLNLNGEVSSINFVQSEDALELSVNGEKFELTYDFTEFGKSYDDTGLLSEIVLYDLNQDGMYEILPLICDGIFVETEGYILKNGSVAWCLYLDGDGTYKLAEGVATSMIDPLCIYADSPDVIWGDFPIGFRLTDGCIEEFK